MPMPVPTLAKQNRSNPLLFSPILSTSGLYIGVGWTLTTYLLEIKLARDRKNARVKYDWFIFNKMIDSNAMSYKDFVADIANSYPWGPNETVTIGYVNMVHKISHHVTTDQDMLEMFEKFVDIKVIPMIIRIHGMNENIDELDHTLVKANICVPDTSSLATPSQVDFSQPSSSTLPSHILVPSDRGEAVKGLSMKNPRMNLGLHLRMNLRMHLKMMVKTNPFPHECSSTRRSETIKAASKFWICEKVKDWLLQDASVGAKELQRRIHETHKVKINYKRVHVGREFAITKLYGIWREFFFYRETVGEAPTVKFHI
uniref:Uncharacterized protein n=1 Tax=Oryza meridionalis TaxID=40149 RepID=A0A0E0DPP5_9ORYZ